MARRKLAAYAEAVVAEYPGIPLPVLLTWSIAPLDAMAVSCLVSAIDAEVTVIDVGTFVGVSAFIFASHPLVRSVTTIDPNPLVTGEVNEKNDALGAWIRPESVPSDLRVADVAKRTLGRFPEEAAKIDFFEGYLAPGTGGTTQGEDPRRFDPGSLDDRAPILAFIDALHTSEGVFRDLSALFSAQPSAIAVLDDCRHYWGPFVQAGIARFLEANTDYNFYLLADLCPGLSSSNLGIVHPKEGTTDRSIRQFALDFDRSVDAITLLEREGQLLGQVSALTDEVADLREALRGSRDELKIAQDRTAEAEDDVRHSAAALAQRTEHERQISDELADLRQSTSWLLTLPLRRLSGLFRHRP